MNQQTTAKPRWWNKRKAAAAVAAVVLVSTLAVSGTFAWTAMSQGALNQVQGTANPGGRLHDDFNGTNKDIYVENYGDQLIFARVQLTQYMETGVGSNSATQTTSLVSGATLADKSTWSVWTPGDVNSPGDPFATYWDWQTGGSTVYMPTFNMDNNSLATDITGNGELGVGSYTYSVSSDITDNSAPLNPNSASGAAGQYTAGQSVSGTEYYADGVTAMATHTAKDTGDGKVMTMADWNALGVTDPAKQASTACWVVDTDGWAYWSQPIKPGSATGLLLNGITLKSDMHTDWYYAIDATADLVSQNEISDVMPGGKTDWTVSGFSADAQALLKTISVTPISLTITNLYDGVTPMSAGSGWPYLAKVLYSDGSVKDTNDTSDIVSWSLEGTNGNSYIDAQTGQLIIGSGDEGAVLKITVTVTADPSITATDSITIS